MNYKSLYERLVSHAKTRQCTEEYYEVHHIIPRCMGGDNSKDNLVALTAREHFIAHLLLHKIYPKNKKIALAVGGMTGNKQRRNLNNREYEKAKKAISLANTIPMPSKETLLLLYVSKNQSYKKIAKQYGVSDMTICKWFTYYQIKSKSVSAYGFAVPPKEELQKLLEPSGVDKIMSHFGISRSLAFKWLKRYNISPKRVVGIPKVVPTKEKLKSLYFVEGLTLLEISKLHNVSRDLVRTWFATYGLKAIKNRKAKHKLI